MPMQLPAYAMFFATQSYSRFATSRGAFASPAISSARAAIRGVTAALGSARAP